VSGLPGVFMYGNSGRRAHAGRRGKGGKKAPSHGFSVEDVSCAMLAGSLSFFLCSFQVCMCASYTYAHACVHFIRTRVDSYTRTHIHIHIHIHTHTLTLSHTRAGAREEHSICSNACAAAVQGVSSVRIYICIYVCVCDRLFMLVHVYHTLTYTHTHTHTHTHRFVALFGSAALFSLLPLLLKDGLAPLYWVSQALWWLSYAHWPHAHTLAHTHSVLSKLESTQAGAKVFQALAALLCVCACAVPLVDEALSHTHAGARMCVRFPDIEVYLFAVVSCACFCAAWVAVAQHQWTRV
jgi:hypothetical protein